MKKLLSAILVLSILSLASCALIPPAALVNGDTFTCEIYGGTTLRSITVKRGEEIVAKLKVSGINIGAEECGLEFIDLNFDGYEDIRIIASRGGLGTKYRCWIWNAGRQSFDTDSMLNSLISPEFDGINKTVTAKYTSHIIEPAVGTEPETYIDEIGTVDYNWRQGMLTAVRKECTTYYSESEIYCVAVWIIDETGELVPASEMWLLPDQYERAGFKPFK